MIRVVPDNAPILMLRSAQHFMIPGRTARSVSVQVPVNPAHYLHVYPVDDEAIHGATGGVYKFRTQQCNENLLILYVNVGDEPVKLTFNKIIAEANMCSLGTEVKQKIYSITKRSYTDRTQELWDKLKLNHNKFVSSDSDLKKELFH